MTKPVAFDFSRRGGWHECVVCHDLFPWPSKDHLCGNPRCWEIAARKAVRGSRNAEQGSAGISAGFIWF